MKRCIACASTPAYLRHCCSDKPRFCGRCAVEHQRVAHPPTVVYSADEDELHDRLSELLADVDVDGGWVDNGIGPYEYWGDRGVHHDWGVELDIESIDVRILEAPSDAVMPEELRLSYSGGGCDGEHRGRCKPCCREWEVDVVWCPAARNVREGVLWITFEPEQS
jgi:hypothetical protein